MPASPHLTAHTPGPWRPDTFYQGTIGKLGYVAVNIPGHSAAIRVYGDYEQANANARLIAAAPELLAVLELLQRHTESYCAGKHCYNSIHEQVHSAIAEATGQAVPQ